MFAAKNRMNMDSMIGPSTRVTGNLVFRGALRIDGEVIGNVIAEAGHASYLVISESARVEGEVRCDHVIVNGEIRGSVYTTQLLEVQPKARITGDIRYKVLEMHGGSLVVGTLSHCDDAAEKPFAGLGSINFAKGL